jgi:hypothetical protein
MIHETRANRAEEHFLFVNCRFLGMAGSKFSSDLALAHPILSDDLALRESQCVAGANHIQLGDEIVLLLTIQGALRMS